MAVAILMLDGSTLEEKPRPGVTCKDFLVEEGIVAGPRTSWFVVDKSDRSVIDDRPLMDFDNRTIQVCPTRCAP